MKIHPSFVQNIVAKNGTILVIRLKYIYNLKAFSMFTFLQENLNTMTISLIGKTNIKYRIIIVSSDFYHGNGSIFQITLNTRQYV